MKEDIIYTYPFHWDKEHGLWYLDTEAHHATTDKSYEIVQAMNIGEVQRGRSIDYVIRANSFDEAYKLINEWIKKQ